MHFSYVLKKIYTITYIIFFSLIYSIAISLFLNPNNLAPGGLSGIAIMLNHLFSFPLGLTLFTLNIPLLIISYVKLGKSLFFKTLLTIALTTVFIDLLAPSDKISVITHNPILASFYGGLLLAVAIAFLFKIGSTTGGIDIVIRLLKLRFPHVETGKLFLLVDLIIVLLSAIVFKSIETALYATITIFISSFFLDRILYGTDKFLLMFIISKKDEQLTKSLLYDLDIGATYLKGIGAYDLNDQKIIMCAIKKSKYPKAEKMIFDTDKNAFLIITSANEILGNGFRAFNDIKL